MGADRLVAVGLVLVVGGVGGEVLLALLTDGLFLGLTLPLLLLVVVTRETGRFDVFQWVDRMPCALMPAVQTPPAPPAGFAFSSDLACASLAWDGGCFHLS